MTSTALPAATTNHPANAVPARKTTPGPHQASPFAVAKVEKVMAPDGAVGQNWYRYVLDNGRSSIVGQRCGSLKDVTAYANTYAEQLNSRNGGASSTWTSRNKK